MNWINENKVKTETLLKVISILAYYSHSEEGLVLLKQY